MSQRCMSDASTCPVLPAEQAGSSVPSSRLQNDHADGVGAADRLQQGSQALPGRVPRQQLSALAPDQASILMHLT